MDTARLIFECDAARTGPPLLDVVTPQRDRGPMPTSEELNELVAAVAGGDRRAFAVLFKHFAPRVKAYLVRGGMPAPSAEELTQEAMVLLWRKSASFDPARAGVSTWIFTIARNLRIDRYRQLGAGEGDGGGTPSIDEHDAPDPGAGPDDCLHARQREGRVREALRQLSPEQLRIIQLSYYEERPHASIAGDLCIPLGTVKSRIRLAVNNLRRLLDAVEP